MGNLRFCVADDIGRERYLEAPPNLTILAPRFDLFTFETFISVQERKSEVGPDRFAGEDVNRRGVPTPIGELNY